ncbi:MAG: hypothetical protein U0165_20845 [Polyangiaceae bacterium]
MSNNPPPSSRAPDSLPTLRPAEIPDTIPAPPDSRVPIETAIRPRDAMKKATAIPVAPRVPSDIVSLLDPPQEVEQARRSGT